MNKVGTAAVCLLMSKEVLAISNFSEFINGFETGVMVRDDNDAYYDYSCEKPKGDSSLAANAKSMVAPV